MDPKYRRNMKFAKKHNKKIVQKKAEAPAVEAKKD